MNSKKKLKKKKKKELRVLTSEIDHVGLPYAEWFFFSFHTKQTRKIDISLFSRWNIFKIKVQSFTRKRNNLLN